MKENYVAGAFDESWALHLAQFLVACRAYDVETMDKANLTSVGLMGGALHYFMELCPDHASRCDWQRLQGTFDGRYASVIWQEEASAMLHKISFDNTTGSDVDERAGVPTLIA